MQQVKLFLVTTTPERSEEIQKIFREFPDFQFVGFCYAKHNPNYEELVKVTKPDIALIESNCGLDPIEIHKTNQNKFPGVDTVMMLPERDFDTLQRAYQEGVPLVLADPIDWNEAVQKIFAIKRRRAASSVQSVPQRRPSMEDRGVTLSFISAKDGEGKTTIAINLAASLAANYNKRVILFDLSSALSEVAMMLNRKAPASYLNILKMMVSDFQFDTIRSLMVDYFNNGRLLTLCGPTSLRVPEIKYFEIDLLIRLLQKNCEYLIIDAPVLFTDALKAALNLSDWHVMITQNHIGSLRNTKLYLAELLKLDYPAHLVKVVLNRVSSSVGLSPADMHRFIDPYPVVCGISSDGPTVLTALNEGTPFVMTNKAAEISQCIDNFAKQILGVGPGGAKHFDIHSAVADFMDGPS